MLTKIQKRDAMIWNIRRIKRTGGCQNTQEKQVPRSHCPPQIPLNLQGIKHVSPRVRAGDQTRVKAQPEV